MKLYLSILLIFTSFISLNSHAQRIISKYNYDYPDNGHLASTLALAAIGVPNGARWTEITLNPRRVRNVGTKQKIKIRLHSRKSMCVSGQNKLIFVLNGLGGSQEGGPANLYADELAKLCFDSVIIPSIFHKYFINSISSEGYVGNAQRDMRDFYNFLIYVKDYLSRNKRYDSYSLTGFSLGAISAGFIGEIDSRRRVFNFDKVLMMNTPVDLMYGIEKLDGYARAKKRVGKRRMLYIKAKWGRKISSGNFTILSRQFFKNFMLSTNSLTQTEKEALIGFGFARSLSGITKAVSSTRQALGYPNPFTRKIKSFSDYFNDVIYNIGSFNSTSSFNSSNSLYAIEDYLRNASNVYLMHNSDDFLLRKQDMPYLKDVFKDRLTVFPSGGHVANIWYPKNLEIVKEILASN